MASTPIRLADIGARGGWQRKWLDVADHVFFVGFEPEQDEFRRLVHSARENEVFSPAVLYREEGEILFYHTRVPSRSSIYRPSNNFLSRFFPSDDGFDVVGSEIMATSTLDAELARIGLEGLDFIKLDTQGSELDVLCGGLQTLRKDTFGIEVEVEFVEMYEGQPLFPEVQTFLNDLGYDFVGFSATTSAADINWWRVHGEAKGPLPRLKGTAARMLGPRGQLRGKKQLIYADAVFLRRPREYLTGSRELRFHRSLVGLFISSVMRYYEYGVQLIDFARDTGSMSTEDHRDLSHYVGRMARRPRHVFGDLIGGLHKASRRLVR